MNSIDGEDPDCFRYYFDLERAVVKKSTGKLRQINLDHFLTYTQKQAPSLSAPLL